MRDLQGLKEIFSLPTSNQVTQSTGLLSNSGDNSAMSKFLESLCYYPGAVWAEMYPSIPLQLSVLRRIPLILVQWDTEQRILFTFNSLSELCHE